METFLRKYNRFVFVPNDSQQIRETIDKLIRASIRKETPIKEVNPINAATKFVEYLNIRNK